MTYKYQDYLFETEDNSILLDPVDYSKFVQECRELIQYDNDAEDARYEAQRERRQADRDKLTGKGKK